jgi:hypothetical protein
MIERASFQDHADSLSGHFVGGVNNVFGFAVREQGMGHEDSDILIGSLVEILVKGQKLGSEPERVKEQLAIPNHRIKMVRNYDSRILQLPKNALSQDDGPLAVEDSAPIEMLKEKRARFSLCRRDRHEQRFHYGSR